MFWEITTFKKNLKKWKSRSKEEFTIDSNPFPELLSHK